MTTVIIGGGIGGIAVAWNLVVASNAKRVDIGPIHVLEASDRFGGNVDTFQFDFGTGPNGQGGTMQLSRWGDLGVNDFNTSAYTKIVSVMNQIGYKAGVNYKNLEDSTCYYSADGSTCFTDSGPWWNTEMPAGLAASVKDFMTFAGSEAKNPSKQGQYASTTIEEFINNNQKARGWDADLGPKVIYPRINGMYFVSELGPLGMPFLAVMHYYAIQEGAGGMPANRCYFVGGTSTWISALMNYMTANMPQVIFHSGYKAVVAQTATAGQMFYVQDYDQKQPPIQADLVVVACHADEGLKAFITGLPIVAAQPMAMINYNNGISVIHTDSRVMPANQNAWSTYNILIHPPGSVALKPYVINYVANRHQNDAQNPAFNTFGLPQFFVSVNPQIAIPENLILKDINGVPAVANLRHNNFDFDTMYAQSRIDTMQGVNAIYYAGGWTHGSGLHEECWAQGEDVANRIVADILGGSPTSPTPLIDTGTFIGKRLSATASSTE